MDFEKWIQMGAPDPRSHPDKKSTTFSDKQIDWKKAREFWSFKVPKAHTLPAVSNRSWPTNRIDYFVLNQLESVQLEPAERTQPSKLIRRLSFDLTGLPPDASTEIHFSGTPNTESLDDWVNQLLASPAFGEHWGRLWLDIARFAEDQAHIVGNNKSLFYPNAYLYRNWVINSFNHDVPYDLFVRKQLAADLINNPQSASSKTDNDQDLVALGFIGLGPKYYRRNSLAVMADEWEDRVDIVTRGLLGLTVACARCHDHKYDPIQTEDYYRLAGIFASTQMHNQPLQRKEKESNNSDKKKKNSKSPEQTMHIIRDSGKPQNLPVFIRGDVNNKGDIVPRGFLTLLNPESREFDVKGSGRKELADAIVNQENPLFARVIVNRVWGKLIGKPLVQTPSNFGALGARPTHPELLDDLAARFMQNGWSIKWLVREIVSSSTYRQTCLPAPKAKSVDPQNRLLSHMNRKRLTVEQFRDSILAANGLLDSQLGGRSINPTDKSSRRRTIYSSISRFQLHPFLANFDFPDPNAHASSRVETITPLQKMFAMNSEYMLFQAKNLRDSIHSELQSKPGNLANDTGLWISHGYLKTLNRMPTRTELDLGKNFLEKFSSDLQQNQTTFLQTLLISNEFLYVD